MNKEKIYPCVKEELYGLGTTISYAYAKSIQPSKVYFPLSEVTFCEKQYKGPHDTDAYLSALYGKSYMTPYKRDMPHMEKIVFLQDEGMER